MVKGRATAKRKREHRTKQEGCKNVTHWNDTFDTRGQQDVKSCSSTRCGMLTIVTASDSRWSELVIVVAQSVKRSSVEFPQVGLFPLTNRTNRYTRKRGGCT